MKKKSGPPAIDVKTLAAFKELKESNNVLVLGCFSNQDSAKAKAFMDAAKKIDDFDDVLTEKTHSKSIFKIVLEYRNSTFFPYF